MAKPCISTKAWQYPLFIRREEEFEWISILPPAVNSIPDPDLLFRPFNCIFLKPTHRKPNMQHPAWFFPTSFCTALEETSELEYISFWAMQRNISGRRIRIFIFYWNTYVDSVEKSQSIFHLPCTGSFLTRRGCSWKQTDLVIRAGRSIKDLSFLRSRMKNPALKSFSSLTVLDLKGSLESDLNNCSYPNIEKPQAEGLVQQDVLLFQVYMLFYILISTAD